MSRRWQQKQVTTMLQLIFAENCSDVNHDNHGGSLVLIDHDLHVFPGISVVLKVRPCGQTMWFENTASAPAPPQSSLISACTSSLQGC